MLEQLVEMGNNAPRVFVYSTGAGAGIQEKIWRTLGCSNFLIGCGFPYAGSQTSKYIGYTPERFVNGDVAMELAMAAYIEAYEPGRKTIGVGLSCSVASLEAHKGAHRIIASSFSDNECLTFAAEIPKGYGLGQRVTDGNLADEIGVATILKAAGLWSENQMIASSIHPEANMEIIPPLSEGDIKPTSYFMRYSPVNTADRAKELILSRSLFSANGSRMSESKVDDSKVIHYPGSFNPLHFGHIDGSEAIRQTAAKRFGECRDIVFDTVANPPHKAAPTAAQLLDKIAMMRGRNFCLTSNDPLFIDKARKHPGAWFGLGADMLITMLDPKWGVDPIELLAELQKLNVKIFVLGRCVKGEFITLEDIVVSNKVMLMPYLDTLLISVPGRWDISSTEIRARSN